MRHASLFAFALFLLTLCAAQDARADYLLQPCIYRRDIEQFAKVPTAQPVDAKAWDSITDNHHFALVENMQPVEQPGIKSGIENIDDAAAKVGGEGMKLVVGAEQAVLSPVFASCLF